jgi:predicted pyridoxine 5'-phosphate oxidase superfamily flavin-nucleotide-binding protein
MLSPDMKRIIEQQRLGFVATAAPDGTPNLSPKGTFVVLDDATIAFGEIRSPGTIRKTESELRRAWTLRYRKLQPNERFEE